MAAYFGTFITGNKKFGGYLSVDNGQSVPLEDEKLLKLDPGEHEFYFSTTPEMDTDETWCFTVWMNHNDVLRIEVYSKGDHLTGPPAYEVTPCTPDVIEDLLKGYKDAKTPKRNPKQIAIGAVMLAIGLSSFGDGPFKEASVNNFGEIPSLLIWGGLAAAGVLLFILGMRKKIRE